MTVAPQRQETSSAISEDETDAESVPNISQLQVEYDVTHDNKSFTLGSLVGQDTPADYRGGRRSRSIDEFIDEKKE
tara:strand:+ start:1414 stop:1641 length:228 start_codon:yes stop_codon:yes gene_type:complete